jgi:serine/threonine protein kinase
MLFDFGISRVLMQDSSGSLGGTTNWMAPEFFDDKPAPSTRESDIWAFGCTCYEVSFILKFK